MVADGLTKLAPSSALNNLPEAMQGKFPPKCWSWTKCVWDD